MARTPKSTHGQEIIITEIYPEDVASSLLPGDLKTLKDKYGDKPCSYEVQYPWKDILHHTWFVDDVYEKYEKTHHIVQRKGSG